MSAEFPSLSAMQEMAGEAAEFMRLFSTPSRLMLLCYIAQRERSVGEIQDGLDFKQPALSQQLAELRQAGVVQTRRASRQVYYSIADGRVSVVMDMLMRTFCGEAPQRGSREAAVISSSALRNPTVERPPAIGEMARWARLERPAEVS